MIITEDLGTVERRYSDMNVKIRQVETGTVWNDAVNEKPCPFTYEETEEPIDDEELDDSEALEIIMGRDADETE